MQRVFLVMAGSMVALIAMGTVFLTMWEVERPAPAAAINIEGADIGGPFELVDHTGATRTSADLIDGPTLIYFGYTYCPDVCPVDTQAMVDVADHLAELEIDATPVFITIDPARDDVETMAAWAEIHHPKMVAMTGSDAQIAAAAEAYKAFYQRIDVEGESGYLMNHSAYLYLADPTGLRALYRRDAPPALVAKDIAWVLDR